MNSTQQRPLSPHLTIWKWGPGMLVSILHRVTGGALTIVGLAVLAWWLMALAGGEQSYAGFTAQAGRPVGMIVLAGLTWAFWQHFFSGLRHLGCRATLSPRDVEAEKQPACLPFQLPQGTPSGTQKD